MIQTRTIHKAAALLLIAAVFLCLAGCASQREMMQERRRPRNRILDVAQALQQMGLSAEQDYSFTLWERCDGQSIHLLQLAKDAVLGARYHKDHDLTLLCVGGSAIVEIEGERQFARPLTAVVVPRLCAYKIIPHESESPFVALLIYSPPWDPDETDVKLLE